MRRTAILLSMMSLGCAQPADQARPQVEPDSTPETSDTGDPTEPIQHPSCIPADAQPEAADCSVEWVLEYTHGTVLERGRALFDGFGQYLEYTEMDADGVATSALFQRFDSRGRMTEYRWDADGDGVLDEIAEQEFDGDGCDPLVTTYDYDLDNIPDETSVYTYDASGRITEIYGATEDGSLGRQGYAVFRISFTYNGQRTIRLWDGDDDHIYETRISYIYDDEDRLVVRELDIGDDSIDSRKTYTWGQDGLAIETHEAVTDQAPEDSYEESWTYVDGRVSGRVFDDLANGSVDQQDHFSYGEEGRLEQVGIDLVPIDGTTDARLVWTYTCPEGQAPTSAPRRIAPRAAIEGLSAAAAPERRLLR